MTLVLARGRYKRGGGLNVPGTVKVKASLAKDNFNSFIEGFE